MIITLQNRGTITVSRELRKKMGVAPGDHFEAKVENGKLILTPVAIVPKTLVLSEMGMKLEAEADEDVRQGNIKVFDTADELIDELEKG